MELAQARSAMVYNQVRPWHVTDEKVLQVLLDVPRERFVPPEYHALAYSDIAIPLPHQQSMLPPKIVGRALQALALKGPETVLEIGTGIGYGTACLALLAKQVVSVELQEPLYEWAGKQLAPFQFRHVLLEEGNAVFGWNDHAPYDAIFVSGAYPLGVPEKVCEQLSSGGRLFAIVGTPPLMKAILITRPSSHIYHTHTLFETVTSPLIHAPQPSSFHF